MARTLKEIEKEIEALETEKKILEEKEFQQKFEELKPILLNTSLTIPQIKKAIKEAEAKKNNRKSETKGRKPRKTSTFKEKKCTICGKMFTPTSARQTVCSEHNNNKSENILSSEEEKINE